MDAEVLGPPPQTKRQLLSCVRWMEEHHEPVDQLLWDGVWQIAQHAKSFRTRLMARRMLADRVDPIPRPPVVAVATGPVSVTWAIPSSSPTPHARSSNGSMTSSPPNGHAPLSSSATDALENL